MPGHFKPIKIVTVQFDLPVYNEDLPLFRGAVIETTGRQNDLFHNHRNDAVIYRYPAIQYKKIRGKAALVCFEQGTEAIHEFFSNTDWTMQLGNSKVDIKVEEVKARQFNVGVWETVFTYSLRNWMPLNQENYQRYHAAISYAEKMNILEKILLGNLLTFCEGMGFKPEEEVKANIVRIDNEKIVRYRGQVMQSYDLTFRTNVSVPNYAALGKGASVGFGIVKQLRIVKNNNFRNSGRNTRKGNNNLQELDETTNDV